MTYRTKLVEVEAFQMTPERMSSNVDWPDWLHAAWGKPPGEIGCICWEGDVMLLQEGESHREIEPGDFIVCTANGLCILSAHRFHATYEEVVVAGLEETLGLFQALDLGQGEIADAKEFLDRGVMAESVDMNTARETVLGLLRLMLPDERQAVLDFRNKMELIGASVTIILDDETFTTKLARG